MSYESLILESNPYAYWRLQEESGETAYDAVGNYDGIYYHNPILGATGPFGKAAEFIFDYDNDIYSCVILGTLGHLGSNLAAGISIECWAKPTYNDTNLIFFSLNDGEEFCLSAFGISDATAYDPPGTRCDVSWVICDANCDNVSGDNSLNPTSKNLYDGNWHHIVLTWDGTSDVTKLYIDGELNKESNVYESVIPSVFVDFLIATMPGFISFGEESNMGYSGQMAEMAIYNRSLTLEEIVTHFEYINPVPPPPITKLPVTVCDCDIATQVTRFKCMIPTRHCTCWKKIKGAWVASITVCIQNL